MAQKQNGAQHNDSMSVAQVAGIGIAGAAAGMAAAALMDKKNREKIGEAAQTAQQWAKDHGEHVVQAVEEVRQVVGEKAENARETLQTTAEKATETARTAESGARKTAQTAKKAGKDTRAQARS